MSSPQLSPRRHTSVKNICDTTPRWRSAGLHLSWLSVIQRHGGGQQAYICQGYLWYDVRWRSAGLNLSRISVTHGQGGAQQAYICQGFLWHITKVGLRRHHICRSFPWHMAKTKLSRPIYGIFGPNLAVKSIKFDQNSVQTWQLVTFSTMADHANDFQLPYVLEWKLKMERKFKIKFFG